MNRKVIRKYRWIEIAILVWTLVAVFAMTVLAVSKTSSFNCFQLKVDSAGDVEISPTTTGWIVKAEGTDGSCGATNTETVTFTISNTDTTRGVSFDISVTSSDASPSGAPSGSQTLAASGSLSNFTATSGEGSSDYTTINISITNIVQESLGASVTTTIKPGIGGTIKVDGTEVTAQTDFTKLDTETYNLTATADSGYTFYGWMSSDGALTTDGAASYTYAGKNAATLWPLFVKTDSAMYSIVGASPVLYYGYLDEAITAAGSNGTITIHRSGIAYHSDGSTKKFTIPDSVTLLIPFDDANTCYTTTPECVGSVAYETPTAYRTLTLANGTTLTVDGAMSVSAKLNYAENKINEGSPTGKVGMVNMESDSSIVVNGALYAWGYITGSGTVTANNGAVVYECFQFMGHRGGSQSTTMDHGVFPLSQYYVQNIEVPLTLMYGAKEYTYTLIYASNNAYPSTINFVGPSNCMFSLTSDFLTKRYDSTTDRLIIDINGNATVSSISIGLGNWGWSVSSANYELPINNNMTVNINSGTVTTNQDLAFLPGSELNIASGATFTVGSGKNIYIYDVDEWGNYIYTENYQQANNARSPFVNIPVLPLTYAPSRGTDIIRTPKDLTDASVCVNGTLDASTGYIYTTESGANIYSTDSGVVKINAGTQASTYQFIMDGRSDGVSVSDTYVPITISPAELKNANGTYVQSTTDTYTYFEGFWHTSECKNAVYWVNDALCACDHQAVAAVVTEKNEYHGTLAATVSAYTRNTGYIQMLTDTEESAIDASDKTVNLDLNGMTVTLKNTDGTAGSLTVAALNGFDTATNALGATGSSYGKIVGTVNGTVAPVHTPDSGANANKTYVAVKDDEGLHFHRVRLGIDHYSFYSYNGQGALTFAAAYLGDSKALGAMVNLGMDVNGTPKWYYDTDKVVAVDTNVTAYSAAADPNSLPGDTTKYKPSGYVLNGTAGIVGPDDSFTIHALLRVKGVGTAKDLTSAGYPDHSATDQTLQMAIDAVKNAGGNDNG